MIFLNVEQRRLSVFYLTTNQAVFIVILFYLTFSLSTVEDQQSESFADHHLKNENPELRIYRNLDKPVYNVKVKNKFLSDQIFFEFCRSITHFKKKFTEKLYRSHNQIDCSSQDKKRQQGNINKLILRSPGYISSPIIIKNDSPSDHQLKSNASILKSEQFEDCDTNNQESSAQNVIFDKSAEENDSKKGHNPTIKNSEKQEGLDNTQYLSRSSKCPVYDRNSGQRDNKGKKTFPRQRTGHISTVTSFVLSQMMKKNQEIKSFICVLARILDRDQFYFKLNENGSIIIGLIFKKNFEFIPLKAYQERMEDQINAKLMENGIKSNVIYQGQQGDFLIVNFDRIQKIFDFLISLENKFILPWTLCENQVYEEMLSKDNHAKKIVITIKEIMHEIIHNPNKDKCANHIATTGCFVYRIKEIPNGSNVFETEVKNFDTTIVIF